MDKDDLQNHNLDKNDNDLLKKHGMLLILILLVIFLGQSFLGKLKGNPPIKTKQDLANYYKISRPTLLKWIKYFTNINLETFKKARKIDAISLCIILDQLGHADENNKPLSKKEIKALAETSDRVLRENISDKFCGISLDVYKKMNVFPPNISKKILLHMG